MKFSAPAMVSASTGRRDLSSSTAATLSARAQSSRVRGPMPGPISSTPVPLPAPLAWAMSRGTQASMRKFWPMALEK